MVSATPIDVDAALPDLGADLNDGLVPFSAEWKAAVQERVDAFVVSLPLGTTQHDAAIEERVAERLYDDEIAAAAVRTRLSEWCKAAKKLQATVKRQQQDICSLSAADASSKQELQDLRMALQADQAKAAEALQSAKSAVEQQATEYEAAKHALLQQHEQKLQEADMRQLQTVINADKRHQRALRQALSDQAATLEQQHAEALLHAQKQSASDAAAAVAEVTARLEAAERQAHDYERAVADAEQRALAAEHASTAAQRQAVAAEEAASLASIQAHGGSEGDHQELMQQLADARQRLQEVEQAHAGKEEELQLQLEGFQQQLADAQQRLQEVEQVHADTAGKLQLQLKGSRDHLAEAQQQLTAREQRHAAESAELQSRLATAREQQQQQQQDAAASSLSAAGSGVVDDGAVAAAVQQRQAALGSEFEQAMQRLEQQLQAQHDAEIAALEQDFAGVTADMQARFDAAMQRERDSHSAQLQGLQGQLQTPAHNDRGNMDDNGSLGRSPCTPLGWHGASAGHKLLLEAPASAVSERRDNPLWSPASSQVTSPPQPIDDSAKAAASNTQAAAQKSTAASSSGGAVAADAAATQESANAEEASLPGLDDVCGAAGCRAYVAHLQQRLNEQSAVLASTQGEAQDQEAELMEALGECQTMVDDLQQYSYDQGRDLATAQTQLQALLADGDGTEAKRLLAAAQEAVGGLREQLTQAKAKADAAVAAAAETEARQKTAATEAAAACGRASAAEAALETALATVRELCEKQALASNSREPGSAGVSQKPVDVLAAELAAETRRRSEAEAICEELTQYNTAVVEQAQEQNEALLAQLHARESNIRELMLRGGAGPGDIAAFLADIDARVLDTATDYQPQPGAPAASPAPRLSQAAGGTPGGGGSATPGLRWPRPRSLSATPLRDAAAAQRLRFSASRDGLSGWAGAQLTPPASHLREQAGVSQAGWPSGAEQDATAGSEAAGAKSAGAEFSVDTNDSPDSTSSVAKEARRLAASLRGPRGADAADDAAEPHSGPAASGETPAAAPPRGTPAENAQADVENDAAGPPAGSRDADAGRSPAKRAAAGWGKGSKKARAGVLAPLQALMGRANLQ